MPRIIFIFLPAALVFIWLFIELIFDLNSLPLTNIWVNLMIIILYIVIVIMMFKPSLRKKAVIFILSLAPVALLYPWAITPSKIFWCIGVGHAGFFLHWLTRYPNFGPVNYEVLLGIMCILSTAVLPAVYAYWYYKRPGRNLISLSLIAASVVMEIALLVRLDMMILCVFTRMPNVYFLALGPVIRLLSVGIMILVFVRKKI